MKLKNLVNRATAVDDLLNTQHRKAEVYGALDVSGDFLCDFSIIVSVGMVLVSSHLNQLITKTFGADRRYYILIYFETCE